MRWLANWLADVRELQRLDGGLARRFDGAIDAALALLWLANSLLLAALATGAGR